MADLLTRLEDAKEGSRELDAEIGQFACDPYAGAEYYCSPPYTASLDAITGLIERELPGVEWDITNVYGMNRAAVGLNIDDGPEFGEGANPALALCIAFVKAMEAQKDE